MFIKTFIKIGVCLILVTIEKIQKFFDPVNKNNIGKMKDEVKGKIIDESIGWKSIIEDVFFSYCK